MSKKRKGFTLIELLAVIVILSVIAFITIPMIMGVIEKSKRQSAIESVNGLLDAGEKYQLNHMLEEKEYATIIDLTSDMLVMKGTKPESGTLVIGNKGRMSIIVKYNNYCIVKTFDEKTPHIVERDPCTIEDSELVDVPNYIEPILNGADPVLESKKSRISDSIIGGLIPIVIENDGTVKKANVKKEWYKYEEKRWANAVILKDESKKYEEEEIIPEENIESYFVWIPKYKYEIWDMGKYDSITSVDNSKVHTIPIVFGLENTEDREGECKTPGISGESGTCKVGDYMTHPAFLSFNTNGLWVGKFETGYEGAKTTKEAEENSANPDKVIVKPNTYSWRNIDVGNAFKTSYEYKRNLESHMMKNTEWGAVAYLQHSKYGSQTSVRVNNNSGFITGYSAVIEPTKGYQPTSGNGNYYETTTLVVDGTYTINYLNPLSGVSSTTGNVTGIYDMSGGTDEYVMGYTTSAATEVEEISKITNIYSDFFSNTEWNKYYDRYSSVTRTDYNNRILGDATGENRLLDEVSIWYDDYGAFIYSTYPWFRRGGYYSSGNGAGIFAFSHHDGNARAYTYRIILAP